jgi:hypothetical protein
VTRSLNYRRKLRNLISPQIFFIRSMMERRKLDSLRYIAEPFAKTANCLQSSKISVSPQQLYRNDLHVKRE